MLRGLRKIISSHSILTYSIFVVATLIVCPLVGSESLNVKTIFYDTISGHASDIDADIFYNQRVPRVLLAFLTGAVLAVAGNTFQVILRNPLATPYTLGVTGGASVGAYLAIAFPVLNFSIGKFSSIQLMAILGAGVVGLMIYAASRKKNGLSMHTMLLAGVTIGIMCGAFIMLIRYLTDPNLLGALDKWTMGRLDMIGFDSFYSVLPLSLAGLIMIAFYVRSLNHIALGEEMASGHGVDVSAVQKNCFIGASVATAAVVSTVGPIGFVGLIVPHMVRYFSGYDNRPVMVGCACMGGAFLVICDAIARTIISPAEIPVGVITALIGGPCFIYLLVSKK